MISTRYSVLKAYKNLLKVQKITFNEAEEVAGILKKNIVQAVLVDNDQKLFKLNITKDTELGDNESIKNPLSAKDLKEQLGCTCP
ncbi:10285_t:CDS:2 [Entrophospora sp. SA101]|nr:10285_t:CDS:2 [Entrophospora sp. SA101]